MPNKTGLLYFYLFWLTLSAISFGWGLRGILDQGNGDCFPTEAHSSVVFEDVS